MKKNLLILALSAMLFSACTKESEYPQVYNFRASENVSSIHVFTKTSEISAPDHASATDQQMVNFSSLTDYLNTIYKTEKFTIINDREMSYQDTSGTVITRNYTTNGNYIYFDGIYLRKGDNTLSVETFAMVTKNYNGNYRTFNNGYPDKGVSLETSVQQLMNSGDTSAARSFDLVYSK